MMHKFYLGLFLILLAACNSGGGGSSSSGNGGGDNQPDTPTVPTEPNPVHTEETNNYSLQAEQSIAVTLASEGYTSATLSTPPSKGLLSGSYPNYTYLSIGGSTGADSAVINLSKAGATKKVTLNFYINAIPVAENFSISMTRGQGIIFDLQASDADGDPLTYTITQNPSAGTLVDWVAGSKTIAYEAPNTAATVTMFYRVSDGVSNSAIAKVTIIVTSTIPSITSPATLTVPEDVATIYTASSTDSGGGAITYSISAMPAHGVITGANGVFTFTPTANYSGMDSFKVKATNSAGGFSEQTVAVTINPVNDAPTFTDFSFSTLKNTDTFYILSTAATDPDSTSISFTSVTQPTKGIISISADRLFYYPNYNATGIDTFTLRACDNGSPIMCDNALVTITITNQVQEPIAIDMTVAANAGVGLPITLNAIYDDINNVSVQILTQPTKGTIVSNGGLSYTYTPNNDGDGEDSAIDYFSFTLTEGGFVSDQAVVTVNISYPFNYIQLNLEGGFKKLSGISDIFHQDEAGSQYYFTSKELVIDETFSVMQAFISFDKDELICPSINSSYLTMPLYFEPLATSEVVTITSDYSCASLKTINSDETDSIYATNHLMLREVNDSENGIMQTSFGIKVSSEENNTTIPDLNALMLNNFERISLDLVSKEVSSQTISSFSDLLITTTISGEGAMTHLFFKSSELAYHYINQNIALEIYHEVVMDGSQMKLMNKFYKVGSQMRKLELLINEWFLADSGEVPEESLAPKLEAGSVLILGDVVIVRREQSLSSIYSLDDETNEEYFEYKFISTPTVEIYNRKP